MRECETEYVCVSCTEICIYTNKHKNLIQNMLF